MQKTLRNEGDRSSSGWQLWPVAAFFGLATQLNWLAAHGTAASDGAIGPYPRLLLGLVLGPLLFLLIRSAFRVVARRVLASPEALARYRRRDWRPFLVFLAFGLGAFGVSATPLFCVIVGAIYLIGTARLMSASRKVRSDEEAVGSSARSWVLPLFFLSGFAALIYQVCWQRALFATFGVNIESITVVVAIFMLGLGLGSLLGGYLSQRLPNHLPLVFLVAEVSTGVFGLVSLELITAVSTLAVHSTTFETAVLVSLLLFFPTFMMGSTLPVLLSYLLRFDRRIGSSVGTLYAVNTVGSALACFATTSVLFFYLGLSSSVVLAAVVNFIVGIGVALYAVWQRRRVPDQAPLTDLHAA